MQNPRVRPFPYDNKVERKRNLVLTPNNFFTQTNKEIFDEYVDYGCCENERWLNSISQKLYFCVDDLFFTTKSVVFEPNTEGMTPFKKLKIMLKRDFGIELERWRKVSNPERYPQNHSITLFFFDLRTGDHPRKEKTLFVGAKDIWQVLYDFDELDLGFVCEPEAVTRAAQHCGVLEETVRLMTESYQTTYAIINLLNGAGVDKNWGEKFVHCPYFTLIDNPKFFTDLKIKIEQDRW